MRQYWELKAEIEAELRKPPPPPPPPHKTVDVTGRSKGTRRSGARYWSKFYPSILVPRVQNVLHTAQQILFDTLYSVYDIF